MAPLIGFFLALPYFGILNSRAGNGQTIGKRLLSLQVVDCNGDTLSFSDSLLRYFVLAIPFYLGNVAFPVTRTPWIASALFTMVTFGGGAATAYLIAFNRRTRQGLHDLAVDSFVADAR